MGKTLNEGLFDGGGLAELREDTGPPPKSLKEMIKETEGYALDLMDQSEFRFARDLISSPQLYCPSVAGSSREWRAAIRTRKDIYEKMRYEVVTCWGPAGGIGREQPIVCYSGQDIFKAIREINKLVKAKVKKGYVCQNPAQTPALTETEVIEAHRKFF